MKRKLPQRRESRKGIFFAALRFLCVLTIGSSACSAQTSRTHESAWSVPLNPDVPLVKQIRLPLELSSVLKGVFLKAGAKEDPTPKPVRVLIAPPQPAFVVPIVVKATTNPAEVAKAQPATLPGTNLPAVFVAPVDISSLTRSASLAPVVDQKGALYLERLRQGDTSPEVFDYLKQLSFTEIVKLIEAVSVWQSTEDKRLLRALAKTLIDLHGISDEKTAGLPNAAVLALADYYADKTDERCVKLYEQLLAKRKTKTDGFVPELNGLAEYYRKAGNYAKAAETHLRAETYSTDKPLLANFTGEAARDYMRLGDEKRANELYERIAQYGYGWAAGIALYDRAIALISKGEHEKAREMLSRPVEGKYADNVRILLLGATGLAYYRAGDLDAAEKTCSQTLEVYKSLVAPLPGEGLEYWTYTCKQVLQWIQEWRKQPLNANPSKLAFHLKKDPQANENTQSIEIRACCKTAIQAEVSHPAIHISVSPRWVEGNYHFSTTVKVEVMTDLPGTGDNWIRLTSTKYPGHELLIPVVQVE